MSIRIIFVLLILIVFLIPTSAFSEELLCPLRTVGPNEPEELLMHETDFTIEKAQESINFLRNDFSKRIWGPEPVKDFSGWSEHYISYMNSLLFAEGALLREEVLKHRLHSQLISKQKPNSKEAKFAAVEFKKAKDRFCTFVENSIYVE